MIKTEYRQGKVVTLGAVLTPWQAFRLALSLIRSGCLALIFPKRGLPPMDPPAEELLFRILRPLRER